MDRQIMLNKIYCITWVSKNIWKTLLSEFPQALDINTCPRKIVCNTCELMNFSGDMLNADRNCEYEDNYGFTGSFFKPLLL